VKFQLTINLDVHEHSPTAHRQIITEMLNHAKQQIGDGRATSGALVHGAAFRQRPIGHWKLFVDEKDVNAIEGDKAA
jgi:hypothetical protein